MPENAKFWLKRKKAAFENRIAPKGRKGLHELASSFHVKTISPFGESAIKERTARQGDALTRNQKHRMAQQFSIHITRVALTRVGLTRVGLARVGLALLITTPIGAMVTPSYAQTVPIPKPAPKARDPLNASDQQRGPATTGSMAVPNPVIPDPHRNVPASLFGSFDATQKAQAARVSSYLSSLQTLAGNFIQVGPDGSKTKGEFYIQKPGKVRFEYAAPSPIAIVADGSMVAVRDRNLATQDIYPLSQTPLRYLLSDRIDLLKDTNVVSVTADDVFISVTIEEKQLLIGTSRLMLMVGAKDGQLKQWTVTDPQGYDTTVAVYNLDTSKKVDPGLFKIDFSERTFPPG
jgi:outer membrane lipoprotein-sorting protein